MTATITSKTCRLAVIDEVLHRLSTIEDPAPPSYYELDLAVAIAAGEFRYTGLLVPGYQALEGLQEFKDGKWVDGELDGGFWKVTEFFTNMDACLDLVQRLLPGYDWSLINDGAPGSYGFLILDASKSAKKPTTVMSGETTRTGAILMSLFRILRDQEAERIKREEKTS